jgi:REP element-mobilizing transposase RayT
MSVYRQILYHIILRTKYDEKAIRQEHAHELNNYIWGVIKNKRCVPYRINGTDDHIHILSDLHPSVALAHFIKDIKVASSAWMKESGLFPAFRGWGVLYCALTCTHKEREHIIGYIRNQREHHKEERFHDEIRRLLKEHGVGMDAKWFWKDE